MSIKTRNLMFICLGLAMALFIGGYITGHSKGVRATQPTLNALKGEIMKMTVELNNNKLYVSSVEQELKTVREAKKAGDVTNKELKVLSLKQVNEISRLNLKIDTLLKAQNNSNGHIIYVDNTDPLDRDSLSYVALPFIVTKNDKWLSLKDSTDVNGNTTVKLGLDFSGDLWSGIDKATGINVAKFTTDCPYINTVTFNSVKLDLPKERKFNLSISAGYGIGRTGLTPIFGITLGRSILRF